MLKKHIQREVILNGVLNALINGAIAWWIFKELSEVPMWGEHGFAFDLIMTACLLMFFLSLIVMVLHRRKVAKGSMISQPWDSSKPLHCLLRRSPRSPFLSALLFGALGLFIVAPVTLLPLVLLDINTLSPVAFALFKALWAGLLGALLVGPVILLGIAEQENG